MKLLFDQNISFRITEKVCSFFPNSKHIKNIGLTDASDFEIWKYAKIHDFTIITFDADFADIAYIKGCPPKIVWLRTGNMTTNAIVEIIEKHNTTLKEFLEEPAYKEIACLEIE